LVTALMKVDLPALAARPADVREQLQAQPDIHLLAWPALLMLARSAVGGGLVAGIAAPAVAAAKEDEALPFLGQVGEQAALLVVGQHLRSHRHLDDEVVAARARAVGARPALAARRPEMLRVAKSMRVLRPCTASKMMSPPLPPSPPSGPPNSTNFSRRKDTAPGPPAPERTKILA
jgi:hypothetical protein